MPAVVQCQAVPLDLEVATGRRSPQKNWRRRTTGSGLPHDLGLQQPQLRGDSKSGASTPIPPRPRLPQSPISPPMRVVAHHQTAWLLWKEDGEDANRREIARRRRSAKPNLLRRQKGAEEEAVTIRPRGAETGTVPTRSPARRTRMPPRERQPTPALWQA